eukprot:7763667-Lingulodinium_polyedra.AAC.1
MPSRAEAERSRRAIQTKSLVLEVALDAQPELDAPALVALHEDRRASMARRGAASTWISEGDAPAPS